MLQLDVQGRWDAEDFIEVLTALESLYIKAAPGLRLPFDAPLYWRRWPYGPSSFQEHVDSLNDWLLAQARATADISVRLSVGRIQYGSPGRIDLVGVGEACEALKEILVSLIRFFTDRRIREEREKQEAIQTKLKETELESANESLRAQKLTNARTLLQLRREYPELHRDYPDVPDDLLVPLIARDQDRLIPRIAEGKLVAARTDGAQPPGRRRAA